MSGTGNNSLTAMAVRVGASIGARDSLWSGIALGRGQPFGLLVRVSTKPSPTSPTITLEQKEALVLSGPH